MEVRQSCGHRKTFFMMHYTRERGSIYALSAQCVELKLRWQFCVHTSTCREIYFQSKFCIIFDISNTKSLLGLAQKHICDIIEEIVFGNCTFLLLSKTISSIMFQICFRVSHSQDRVFKISKIIQNFD